MKYTHTLVALEQRAQFHARHLKLIEEAQKALETGADVVYEAHRQQDMPNVRAIMAESSDLREAVEKCRRLSRAYNGSSRGDIELFVRVGTIRIAIDPLDAGEGFTLDSRIAKSLAAMVFAADDKAPSFWYAETPTPEPEPAAVTV